MSADILNISVSSSSIKKGETLIDTAATLNAMHPDFLILRHPNSGAAEMLSKHVECSIINAGDGRHEHPTQALLDAAVIKEEDINLEGLKIVICGDILNSRVARSNIYLLTTMGAQVSVIGPPTLIPKDIERMGVKVFFDLNSGLKSSDIIMILRLQNERMDGSETPSKREYYSFFGIDENNLKLAKKNAQLIMKLTHCDAVKLESNNKNLIIKTASNLQARNEIKKPICITLPLVNNLFLIVTV